MLADNNSTKVFGCGIDGQLAVIDYTEPTAPVLGAVINGEPLVQSRSLLWDDVGRLVVANRDFLFYRYRAAASTATAAPGLAGGFALVANVSTALSSRPSRGGGGAMGGDNGINGAVIVQDTRGTRLLVGAAMPGLLVAAKLGDLPEPFGSCEMKGQGKSKAGLEAAFDLSPYRSNSTRVPLLVVVSPENEDLLTLMQLTRPKSSGVFAPPQEWSAVGTLGSHVLDHVGWNATGRGCNRVRVHREWSPRYEVSVSHSLLRSARLLSY